MPTTGPQKEPIENLKDLIGFKWSTIIIWLVGLIPTAFFLGLKLGIYISNTNEKIELATLELKHQKELYEARESGKNQAMTDIKNTNEQAQIIIDILKKGQKK